MSENQHVLPSAVQVGDHGLSPSSPSSVSTAATARLSRIRKASALPPTFAATSCQVRPCAFRSRSKRVDSSSRLRIASAKS